MHIKEYLNQSPLYKWSTQGHPHGIFSRLHALYQQYFYSVVFNGLCTSNISMVFQVVVLWLYMSYKFWVAIYLITKIYFIGRWRGLSSTLRICIVLLQVKCCVLVDDYHISKTPVKLPTFFLAIIDLQVLLFNNNICVHFQPFFIL